MKSALDVLLEKADILDVVAEHVKLRKAGRNFIGLCPFHKEKTPSFTVSPDKGIFYCFGCHQGGNALNFVMKYERLTFQEALENLARKYGVTIGRGTGSSRPRGFDALARLEDYYHKALKASPRARDYLSKRGIGPQTIDEFKLGFSDPAKGGFKQFLGATGIGMDIFLSTGVIRLRDGEPYDIFRGRVIIPIRDTNGKTIAFGGRAVQSDALPKYINSPESQVFTKRTTLFGIDKTRKAIADADEALVVEGYFDLISLHGAGIVNAVASLGTAITEEQVVKLRQYTNNITLMLDGDEAGIKSALRLIPMVSEIDVNCKVVLLPPSEDPDSMVRKKGAGAVRELMAGKMPIVDHAFQYYRQVYPVEDFEGRMGFVRTILPVLMSVGSAVKRRLYIKRLSELTGVEEHHFWNDIEEAPAEQHDDRDEGGTSLDRKVLGALMNRQGLLEGFLTRGGLELLADEKVRGIIEALSRHTGREEALSTGQVLAILDKDELRDLAARADFDVATYEDAELEQIVLDFLDHMRRRTIRQKAKDITNRLSEAERLGDEQRIVELLKQKQNLLFSLKPNPAVR
jgi:DNA primase